jgi:hypothetical protein
MASGAIMNVASSRPASGLHDGREVREPLDSNRVERLVFDA